MCTVTYIPTSSGVLLTSNRDERSERAPAFPPAAYLAGNQRLTYPKDAQAGGTWIAFRDGYSAAVLLNGGFRNHARKPQYRKSRGLIMLDILAADSPVDHFGEMGLDDIEPFTLIFCTYGKLLRCTWDGEQKHIDHLDSRKAHIWSSATLYGGDVQSERKRILENWLSGEPFLTPDKVLDFHLSDPIRYETGYPHSDGHLRTVSVTLLELPINSRPSMRYHDLAQVPAPHAAKQTASETPNFNSFYWRTRRFLIRLRHWEYWPMELLYLPLVPLWLWLSLRARSLLFFSAANPGIAYSGFIHERKSNIYPLLPPGSYPETVLCKAGMATSSIRTLLAEQSLNFPLIAKPDIGERGIQVKLLRTWQDLEAYHITSKVDFLLQQYIDYENEVGIFYYRLPGAENGHISGIVGKEFLNVTGDGESTLLTMMMRDSRTILQLPALVRTHGNQLQHIPAAGQTLNLVPYGNHSRGAKFIDLTSRTTPKLTAAIDHICSKVPGFYFGRLDIRFKSWEDLEAGRNFSIIELNGTGSEPTHIYDPAHSLLFAWKEIYRHWQIAFRISRSNARTGKQRLMTFSEGRNMHREHRKHLRLLNTI